MTVRCPRCNAIYIGWSPLTVCTCGWVDIGAVVVKGAEADPMAARSSCTSQQAQGQRGRPVSVEDGRRPAAI